LIPRYLVSVDRPFDLDWPVMIGPSIDPAEVGVTGLLWLFLSYGFALYQGANLISEGSELLLLVPSLAGLVGGVVLPLLGAVPDGAIILFSGLGSIEEAQETLSVGVGALVGSTIMLLTIPFFLSILGGRVDYNPASNKPNYFGKPKLTTPKPGGWQEEITTTGIALTDAVQHGGIIMMWTTLPYFLIQGPALFLHGPDEEVALDEHWWSFAGLVICLIGLCWYMSIQLHQSQQEDDKGRRMAVLKKQLQKGAISLSGAVAADLSALEAKAAKEYQEDPDESTALTGGTGGANENIRPPPSVAKYLKELLNDGFRSYDTDGNGQLDRQEVYVFFRDFNEAITDNEMNDLFEKFDEDNSGTISLEEFICVAYLLIKLQDSKGSTEEGVEAGEDAAITDAKDPASRESRRMAVSESLSKSAFSMAEEEEEEIPEELTDLPPDQQQAAITKKAFTMLAAGSILVLYFSDPMVDVLSAIADRVQIGPFYVSFVLAPLASNASELIASQYYASKKTRKSISVALSALEGAACMNNTFCLSIFMALIFFRGLAWQYTAETLSILICQFVVGFFVQASDMKLSRGVLILSIFPLSIALVAGLEAIGLD